MCLEAEVACGKIVSSVLTAGGGAFKGPSITWIIPLVAGMSQAMIRWLFTSLDDYETCVREKPLQFCTPQLMLHSLAALLH